MLRNCLKSCNSKNCDNGIQKPQGTCANPLGLAMDEFGKYKLPDSAFSAPTGWLAPGELILKPFLKNKNGKNIKVWHFF